MWQLQSCYKFHTFPHASQRCVPATLTERHTVPTPPSSNLVPSQSLSLLCLSSAFSSTVSAVSDLLQNYINCNSLFLAFCFLLSSPSLLFSLSLCYAIIICSMPCKIVGVIVMRGTRQVASWGRVSVCVGSETSSGFAVAVRVMQMQESCN